MQTLKNEKRSVLALINECLTLIDQAERRAFDLKDASHWITTEDGHHLLLDGEGNILKGNPHVINAIKGYHPDGKPQLLPRGREGDNGAIKKNSRPVADKDRESDDASPGEGGEVKDRSPHPGATRTIPAPVHVVNKRIDRVAAALGKAGQHQVVDWLHKLKAHVNSVGVQDALDTLSEGSDKKKVIVKEGDKGVGYMGADADLPDWVDGYLRRNGISVIHDPQDREKGMSVVSSDIDSPKRKGDFIPVTPKEAKNKLKEAQMLPGLESSMALDGAKNLSPALRSKLDKKYGKDKWIVKPYDEEGAGGFGIYFPQRVEQIQKDAQSCMWNSGAELAKYGFHIQRNSDNEAIGIRHESGEVYPFNSKKYKNVIHGEARKYGDIAKEAAKDENGPALDGAQFMVQAAFPVVGITEQERAQGITGASGGKGEARTHIVTHDGDVDHIPSSTWIKGEHMPVVFETKETKEIRDAALKAIKALPASERNGQTYAPDVIKTKDGYKVIELNPANETGGSGYLTDNPMIIDSYVSHITGQEPAHVKWIKGLLGARKKGMSRLFGNVEDEPRDNDGKWTSGGGGADNLIDKLKKIRDNESNDATRKTDGGREDRDQGGDGVIREINAGGSSTVISKKYPGLAPEGYLASLQEKGLTPVARKASRAEKDLQEAQLIAIAKKSKTFIKPTDLESLRSGENLGANEHEVYRDFSGEPKKYWKITNAGSFGISDDATAYVHRHETLNKLWPELGYKIHGVTSDQGMPQFVISMNNIEGEHPKDQSEIDDYFKSIGWDKGVEINSFVDPESGTKIYDAHPGNFIKTATKLVPIDVDISDS